MKPLFILLFFVGIFGAIMGYSFFVVNAQLLQSDANFIAALSKNIYVDDTELSQTIVIYQSSGDISNHSISSTCPVSSEFLTRKKNLFFFQLKYLDTTCKNPYIALKYEESILASSSAELQVMSGVDDYDLFLDYSTADLEFFSKEYEKQQQKYSLYKNYNKTNIVENFSYARGQRMFFEAAKKKNAIDTIIQGRKQKYSSPVQGYGISEKFTKIPNSGRPYREGYTLGIHQGWDIDAPLSTPVQALDDGMIVRVVRNFADSDFERIEYGSGLTLDQKRKNLDILRGNQVWLKTMKGEVVFYSHLGSVPENIEENILVKRGEKLGEVGATGVPEAGYEDYHLHLEIMENPYIPEKAGKYNFGDYMTWKWKTQGSDEKQTVIQQKEIFE